MRGFSEALRRELADTRVGVWYVAPRATRTRMNSPLPNLVDRALHKQLPLIRRLSDKPIDKDPVP